MSVKQPGGGDGKAGSAPGIDAPPVRHLARPRDACRLAGSSTGGRASWPPAVHGHEPWPASMHPRLAAAGTGQPAATGNSSGEAACGCGDETPSPSVITKELKEPRMSTRSQPVTVAGT
jgi:hypothetical protein